VDDLRYRNVSFLSDYGRTDEFVGVVHAVIHQLCPGVRVVDVTHDVPPFDVRAGGLTLARSVQYLPPGVVVAVVDPGVGTARRRIAVEVGDGASVLVGPDNGLLAPAVAMVGGATRAVALTDTSHHLDAPGPLFDGRDVFAPVAARLCAGVPLEDLGEPVDPAGLVPGLMPVARPEPDGSIAAEALWVDRFGNVQLNLGPDDLPGGEEHLELRLGDRRFSARRAVTFADVGAGALGLVVDSYGMLAVVADRSSAAEELGVAAGDEVVVAALEGDGPPVAVTTTVRLRGSATGADAPTATGGDAPTGPED
jgi:S-adenosylmethionine hydrolase